MPEIDNRKLFDYVHNELSEKEKNEVEELITRDPEALKIVNEYLFLKQNLKELPVEALEAISEKTKDESSIFGKLVASAGKYIAWDLRPNLAFAVFALVIGVGVYQLQNQPVLLKSPMENPLLNSLQKTEVEQYFNALQKGGNPQPLLYIEINDPIGVVEQIPMIAEDCEERKAILTNQHIRLKFCTRGNKYEIVEQTIIYNK